MSSYLDSHFKGVDGISILTLAFDEIHFASTVLIHCLTHHDLHITGARLIDVIRAMGYTDDDLKKHKYVQFEGLDIDPSGVPYGSSIATEKAMDENHCVMVAYEMNGK